MLEKKGKVFLSYRREKDTFQRKASRDEKLTALSCLYIPGFQISHQIDNDDLQLSKSCVFNDIFS